MDTSQWTTQEFGVAKSEEMGGARAVTTMERKARPQKEEAVNCPRCHSTNTKFCYYNNYSLTQPRYFCKTCRRYWTEGGTLRNVPVGGGSRKNKRYTATPPPPPPQKHHLNPAPLLSINSHNPKVQDIVQHIQGHDLNLGFQDYHNHGQFLEFPKIESRDNDNVMHASSSTSALNFLRGFNSFMPMAQNSNVNNIFASAGFPFQECKPPISFPVDDVSNGYGNPNLGHQNMNGTANGSSSSSSSSSLMFALGSTSKRNTSTSISEGGDQDKAGQENGFWNGMLGGASANW